MNSGDCKLRENKISELVKTLKKDYTAEVLNIRNYMILTALLDLDECDIYMEDVKKFDLASTIIRFTKESNQIKKVSMRLMSKFCKAKSRGLNNQLIQKTKPKEIPVPVEPVETKPKEFSEPVDISACKCEISANSAHNFKVLHIPDQASGSALDHSSQNDIELDYASCETPAYPSDTEEGEISDLENKDPDSWDSDDSNYKYSVLPGLEYLARPRKSEKNKEEAGQKVAVECVACPKQSENIKDEISKKITVRGGGGKLRAMAALLNIDLCKLDSNGKDSELRRKVAEESSSSEEDCDSDDSDDDKYSVLPGLEHLKEKNEAKADHGKNSKEREEKASGSTVSRQVNMPTDQLSASGKKAQKEAADKPVKENKQTKEEEQKDRKRRGEPLSGDVVPRKRVRGEEKKKLYNHLKETGTVQRLF